MKSIFAASSAWKTFLLMKKWIRKYLDYFPWFVDFWYYIVMVVLFIVLAVIFL